MLALHRMRTIPKRERAGPRGLKQELKRDFNKTVESSSAVKCMSSREYWKCCETVRNVGGILENKMHQDWNTLFKKRGFCKLWAGELKDSPAKFSNGSRRHVPEPEWVTGRPWGTGLPGQASGVGRTWCLFCGICTFPHGTWAGRMELCGWPGRHQGPWNVGSVGAGGLSQLPISLCCVLCDHFIILDRDTQY